MEAFRNFFSADSDNASKCGNEGIQSFFNSVDDYVAFMRDPSRIIRLEWRKVRRVQHRGYTSHSWLEAYLLAGNRLRLEFFADHGFMETDIGNGRPEPQSVLYENRAAAAHEFSQALKADRLREIAAAVAATRPYSVSEFNCHHFVLEVWNAVVIEMLQRSHYPDRVKTSVLWGLDNSVGSWLANFSSLSSANVGTRNDIQANFADVVDDSPHAKLSAWAEEGSRVSGEVSAIARTSPDYNRAGRLEHFACALATGTVHLLEPKGNLIPMSQPPVGSKRSISDPFGHLCEVWAEQWVPDKKYAAVRLAEHMGVTDTVELVARILKPETAQVSFAGRSMLGSLSSQSFNSQSLAGGSLAPLHEETITDVCYVVLAGQRDLRVAIYALLHPIQPTDSQVWRLRLVSGDACSGQESNFKYTLQDVPEGIASASARDMLRAELQPLQFAMATGDWGFITLL